MFKRTIGKELTSLKDYHNTILYVKIPIGETYFVDTPVNEDYFNHHVSQGYIFYEVVDIPYSNVEIKEIENWKRVLSGTLQDYIDDESDVRAVARKLVESGYRVVKIQLD